MRMFKEADPRKSTFRGALCRPAWLLLLLAAAARGYPALPVEREGGGLSEYEIKAAYLCNFARFVE